MRRAIAPILIGVIGAAILISLGVWQLQRLAWKEAMLAEMEARIAEAPDPLPAEPSREEHLYEAVEVTGRYLPQELHALTSTRAAGAGYRVISSFETEGGRRVLVERGFVPQAEKEAERPLPGAPITVTGNLHWPQETDGFTPDPDLEGNIWYARDVPAMAAALDTEPVLLIARKGRGAGLMPLPLDTSGIPNDHLGYAVTWFSLAIVWAGMTVFWLWRIRRQTS